VIVDVLAVIDADTPSIPTILSIALKKSLVRIRRHRRNSRQVARLKAGDSGTTVKRGKRQMTPPGPP